MTKKYFPELEAESKDIRTTTRGPSGELPFTEDLLLHSPSGDIFGMMQNAGMGWDPNLLQRPQTLILSTSGGLRGEDGTPIALGYHTGHWELNLLVREAAEELRRIGSLPFAAYCSDPCDGRSQGTDGMMDSLPYRNTAAEAFGRLVRSLPTRKAVMGIATCDKGLPAMMMTLAECRDLPVILIPGGVTLLNTDGEDAGTVQSVGIRYAHQEISLEDAARLGCAACASPGGGCQFLGTAASSQVIGEALGLSLPHTALIPSGEKVWLQAARDSARALSSMQERGITSKDILTPGAIRNAMTVHAAFGASTNLLLHLPAIAFSAGLERPRVEDWDKINQATPRIVDVLPNGPEGFVTAQVYLAGAVPEAMLHLRDLDLLDLACKTVSGQTLGDNLAWWEKSERRQVCRELLQSQDGIDPNQAILSPTAARAKSMSSTVTFPLGNIAPEGSVVKSTAIDASLCPNGVYEHIGPARVFISEVDAMAALKKTGDNAIKANDIIVLTCNGPMGAGMPETAQVSFSLKYTKALKHVAMITDGRFSGFSSGACIGHVGPEALAGGPIGKVRDGDILRIYIDKNTLRGNIDLLGSADCKKEALSIDNGTRLLGERESNPDLKPQNNLPDATRLWGVLQQSGGGTWGGCVYDTDKIVEALSK